MVDHGGNDSDLPSMATAAMVGRWKGRATRCNKKEEAKPEKSAEEFDTLGQTLSHGAVRWPGSRLRPAKWARVPHETPFSDVMQLVTRTWGLTSPSALISIIGTSNRSLGHAEQLFGPGLKRAAETTHAWILTDGAFESIGGLVGSHVQPLPCIGVQSWSTVADNGVLRPNRTTIMPRSLRSKPHRPTIPDGPPQPQQPWGYGAPSYASPPPSPPSDASFLQQVSPFAPRRAFDQPSCSAGSGSALPYTLQSTAGSYNGSFNRRRMRSRTPPEDADDDGLVHLDSYHSHFVLIDENWDARSLNDSGARAGTSARMRHAHPRGRTPAPHPWRLLRTRVLRLT
jgi:hypothetical protein